MKKILLYLLSKYTRNPADRKEIFRFLNKQIKKQYYEDNAYSCYYALIGEDIDSNKMLDDAIFNNRVENVAMLRRGLRSEIDYRIDVKSRGCFKTDTKEFKAAERKLTIKSILNGKNR